MKISLKNNAIQGGFVILQTSIFSLDFFLFRFRLSSQGSSRPLFFRCDYSDRFRCQSKVGIFCKSCVRVETTLRASLSSALLRFLTSILVCFKGQLYIKMNLLSHRLSQNHNQKLQRFLPWKFTTSRLLQKRVYLPVKRT